MAKREMVAVRLFEDGTYEVNDIDSNYVTQRYYGNRCDTYYCSKAKWKEYLLKLCSTERIDKQIAELTKRKKKMEKLRIKLEKELKGETNRC